MSLGAGQTGAGTTQTNQQNNSSQNQLQTMATGPYSSQIPYLMNSWGNATNLMNNQSNTLPTNPLLSGSWQSMMGAASNTPSFLSSGNDYINNVLTGQFLSPNSNPYLAGMESAAAQPVINQYQTAIAPQTASAAEMANRYGSGAANQMMNQAQTTLGTTLSNLASNFYGNAYNQGINQMNTAAAMAPAMLQANYMPAELENQVGQQAQNLSLEQAQYPWQTAQAYQNIVGGNYGQSGTVQNTGTGWSNSSGAQSTPYYSNPLGSIFGGALAGLGVAGQLGWSPFGAGAAGAGGLLPSGAMAQSAASPAIAALLAA